MPAVWGSGSGSVAIIGPAGFRARSSLANADRVPQLAPETSQQPGQHPQPKTERREVDKVSPPTYYSSIMASKHIQHRIDRLDQIEEAVDQLGWEGVRSRARAVLALVPENVDVVNLLASAERALSSSAPSPTVRWQPPHRLQPLTQLLPAPSLSPTAATRSTGSDAKVVRRTLGSVARPVNYPLPKYLAASEAKVASTRI